MTFDWEECWNRRATPQADAAPFINCHAINDLFLKWSEWTTELGEAISRKNIDGFVSELRAAIAAGGAQESVRPRYQYAQPGSPEFDGAEAYQQHLEEQDSEPVAWVRYRSDGGFEGPIMDTDARMCDTRRSFWTPLYAAPLANEASKPAAQQTLSDGAQFFACYLIDNCENEVVREESVQAWLGKMLASPRYHPAAPSVDAQPVAEAWQPIETAPKYGDPIDIWGRYGRTPNCVYGKPTYTAGLRWVHEAGYDSNGPVFELVVDPTHWMPLPEAPAALSQQDPQ